MEGQRFDHVAKALAGGLTRRRVLRGAVGGLVAAAGLRVGLARAGQAKKSVCHFTGSTSNPWEVIEVAEPGYEAHRAHGDKDFVDCCSDDTCLDFDTCGGGGVEGQCGCTPLTYEEACGDQCSGEVSDGCGGSHTCSCSVCEVITLEAPACFWQENISGNSCWTLDSPFLPVGSQEECQALDSCSPGGGGASGGGCYKWATSSDTQIAPPW
jgi:hypothetical protein